MWSSRCLYTFLLFMLSLIGFAWTVFKSLPSIGRRRYDCVQFHTAYSVSNFFPECDLASGQMKRNKNEREKKKSIHGTGQTKRIHFWNFFHYYFVYANMCLKKKNNSIQSFDFFLLLPCFHDSNTRTLLPLRLNEYDDDDDYSKQKHSQKRFTLCARAYIQTNIRILCVVFPSVFFSFFFFFSTPPTNSASDTLFAKIVGYE